MLVKILRGPPCAGKDTYLQSNIKAGEFALNVDALRATIFQYIVNYDDRYSSVNNNLLFKMTERLLKTHLEAKSEVVWVNATNITWMRAERYINIAESYGADVEVISIDPVSPDQLYKRNLERENKTGVLVRLEDIISHCINYFDPKQMDAFENYRAPRKTKYTFRRIACEQEVDVHA